MITKYYSSFDSVYNILHVYVRSNKGIVHINVTYPLINVINEESFRNAENRDGGLKEIPLEDWLEYRNRVLKEFDMI